MGVDAMLQLIKARGVKDPQVLDAMRHVPRHRFVPEAAQNRAYGDYPLAIGQDRKSTRLNSSHYS